MDTNRNIPIKISRQITDCVVYSSMRSLKANIKGTAYSTGTSPVVIATSLQSLTRSGVWPAELRSFGFSLTFLYTNIKAYQFGNLFLIS